MEAEARFRAMGTDVHVIVVDGRFEHLERARYLIDDLEARWSRFRPASEVSLINQMAGMPVRVSASTVELVRRAIEGARVTGGRFDPTVLGDVVRAGYDRSFELLTETSGAGRSTMRSGVHRIVVDVDASTVTLPAGVGFDPGGIGKGLAADMVAEGLLALGASGVCVNVGGDLRVEGEGPGGGAWKIGVAHPFRTETVSVGIQGGAVATSMRTRRTWGHPSERRHHLIDPDTGRPARSGLASATVIASKAWQAEVVAKGAFVAGLSEGLFLLAATGTDGMLVDDRGVVYPSAGLDEFLADRGVTAPASASSPGAA
jgi:FAD:protein FMN transferase